MVHLQPLPGSPGYAGDMKAVVDAAVKDARTLEEGGADGIIAENFFDAPFTSGRVEAVTVAAMTCCISEVVRSVSVPVGVNVLRNDALSALSVAEAVGASMIRVNVLTHAMVTDQGIIEGCSYELSRLKARLGSRVKILADVMVKHAYPLGDMDLAVAAKDIGERGGADALIVSGTGTGMPLDVADLRTVRDAVPEVPVASGSGVNEKNIRELKELLDVVIIGTWIKEGGRVENPVDPARVAEIKRLLS
jgi:hypothetical protein